MAERGDVRNTLAGADVRNSTKDLKDGDLGRGFFDPAPTDSYEGSLDMPMTEFDMKTGEMREVHRGTIRPGQMEAESDFKRTHGMMDEYGFVRRPCCKGDVERN